MTDLADTARALFAPGKGVLAADESVATADKRLTAYGIKSDEEMRRKYRELFLNCEGVERHLSGVILYEETFGQKGSDKKRFVASLAERGIEPGIKVDGGTEPFPESPDELITKGLIGLPERLTEFKNGGAAFTKWRAVIKIEGDRLPSATAILENAKRLASYAKAAQEAGLVPFIEPEVLLDGRHSRARAKEVLRETLTTVFDMLKEHAVDPSGIVLKTAMALTGSASGKRDTPEEVAIDTVDVLVATVPRDTAGVVFLSGGQTPDQATENLRAIAKRARAASASWPLTFSYARALQEEALSLWKGEEANVPAAQAAFMERLAKVAQALTPSEG